MNIPMDMEHLPALATRFVLDPAIINGPGIRPSAKVAGILTRWLISSRYGTGSYVRRALW